MAQSPGSKAETRLQPGARERDAPEQDSAEGAPTQGMRVQDYLRGGNQRHSRHPPRGSASQ